MESHYLTNLQCVNCAEPLQQVDSISTQDCIICLNCNTKYPIIDGIPILINEKNSIFSFEDFKSKKSLFFDISLKGRTINAIKYLIPPLGRNWNSKRNFKRIQNLLKENREPTVLILGGSIAGEGMKDFLSDESLYFVESDVSFGPRTKIVFDAHNIPYKEETFDAVIVQAVLEHVLDPNRCVDEIHRVLKQNGIVYAETPFMQQVHGGPYDFTRFTHSGHRFLFKNFTEISSGLTGGPGTVLLWCYEYFFLSLFGFTKTLRLIIKVITRITGFWLPLLDWASMWNKNKLDAASGLFFIGRKSCDSLERTEIIPYYYKNHTF